VDTIDIEVFWLVASALALFSSSFSAWSEAWRVPEET
jgi:hypothetical protein